MHTGVAQGMFHPDFQKKFQTLYDQHDIERANTMLNVADFPDVERSAGEVDKAAKNTLRFGAAVLNDWPKFAEYFGRTNTHTHTHI